MPARLLRLGAEGEATTLVVGLRPKTHVSGCTLAGVPVRVSIVDAAGELLPISGNPAVARLSHLNVEGLNVFDWRNWCGPSGQRVYLVADVGRQNSQVARIAAPLKPACLAASARSHLTVIKG
jgi:hypothetical protein